MKGIFANFWKVRSSFDHKKRGNFGKNSQGFESATSFDEHRHFQKIMSNLLLQ